MHAEVFAALVSIEFVPIDVGGQTAGMLQHIESGTCCLPMGGALSGSLWLTCLAQDQGAPYTPTHF